MAEDRFTFTFENQNPKAKMPKILDAIKKCYSKLDIKLNEVSGGRDRKSGLFSIDLWPHSDDRLEGAKRALQFLQTLPSEQLPYVRVELDQTGEEFFYLLQNDELYNFSDEVSLNAYLSANSKNSIENNFYNAIDEAKSSLFVRISFSKKSQLKSAHSKFSSLLDDEGKDLTDLKRSVLEVSKGVPLLYRYLPHEIDDFPKPDEAIQQSNFFMGSLCFADMEKNFLYLGFQFQENFKLLVHHYCNGNAFDDIDIRHEKTKLTVVLLEHLAKAHGSDILRAKFRPYDAITQDKESHFVMSAEYLILMNAKPLPNEIWPS